MCRLYYFLVFIYSSLLFSSLLSRPVCFCLFIRRYSFLVFMYSLLLSPFFFFFYSSFYCFLVFVFLFIVFWCSFFHYCFLVFERRFRIRFSFLWDRDCSIVSSGGKFCLPHGLRQPTRDIQSDVSCLCSATKNSG